MAYVLTQNQPIFVKVYRFTYVLYFTVYLLIQKFPTIIREDVLRTTATALTSLRGHIALPFRFQPIISTRNAVIVYKFPFRWSITNRCFYALYEYTYPKNLLKPYGISSIDRDIKYENCMLRLSNCRLKTVVCPATKLWWRDLFTSHDGLPKRDQRTASCVSWTSYPTSHLGRGRQDLLRARSTDSSRSGSTSESCGETVSPSTGGTPKSQETRRHLVKIPSPTQKTTRSQSNSNSSQKRPSSWGTYYDLPLIICYLEISTRCTQ